MKDNTSGRKYFTQNKIAGLSTERKRKQQQKQFKQNKNKNTHHRK